MTGGHRPSRAMLRSVPAHAGASPEAAATLEGRVPGQCQGLPQGANALRAFYLTYQIVGAPSTRPSGLSVNSRLTLVPVRSIWPRPIGHVWLIDAEPMREVAALDLLVEKSLFRVPAEFL